MSLYTGREITVYPSWTLVFLVIGAIVFASWMFDAGPRSVEAVCVEARP